MATKQMEIPGTEAPKIKEIDQAAEAYVDARDKRMKQSEKESDAKQALITAVQNHLHQLTVDGDGNRVYKFDDRLVILTDTVGVKVRTAKEGGEKHSEDDDD